MQDVLEILKDLDWSPLIISLKTGIVATVFSFFLGIFAARKVVKASPGKKAVIDGILTLPMVLPPTVAGFFLLLIFSKRRPFGEFLFNEFGIKVVQTWLGCIIAATVIAFPLMYRKCKSCHGADRRESDLCRKNTWNVRYSYFLENCNSDCRTGNRIRNNPDLCPCIGGVRCDFHAGGKYSGKNRNNLPEDRHGNPGWRLPDSRCVGSNRNGNCIPDYYAYECSVRKKDEEYQQVVKDGD